MKLALSNLKSGNDCMYLTELPEKEILTDVWGIANSELYPVPFDMTQSTENAYSSLGNLTITANN